MQMSGLIPEPGSLYDRITTFILVNVLWFLLAVTVVALPPATAGVFAVLAAMVRGRDPETFATFFGAMRRLWLKSTVILLVDGGVGLLLAFNMQMLRVMDPPLVLLWTLRSLYLFVALAGLMINVYLWPLLVLVDLPLRRLVSLSTRLAFAHLAWSGGTLVMVLLPFALALVVPVLLTAVLLFSLIVWVITWRAWRIIARYATPDDLAEMDRL